jgi:hypothetical protein
MFLHQNHGAGGGNGSVMVRMIVCLCLASEKPSKREFFVPARTTCDVLFRCGGEKNWCLFPPETPEISPRRHRIGEKKGGARAQKKCFWHDSIFSCNCWLRESFSVCSLGCFSPIQMNRLSRLKTHPKHKYILLKCKCVLECVLIFKTHLCFATKL